MGWLGGTTEQRQPVEAPPPPASDWTFVSLGDDVGSIEEITTSQLAFTTAGTNDPDQGQFAYQTISAGNDIEVITKVPANWTGTPENFTFFGVQIRTSLAADKILFQCAWPDIGAVRAKQRETDGGAMLTIGTGVADKSLPYWTAITYDYAASLIKQWESGDGIDWFQVGSQFSIVLPETFVGPWAVSHDLFSTIIATMTECTVSTTLTISEADPPVPDNRIGIIQTNLFENGTFDVYGSYVDNNGAYRTFDVGPGNNTYRNMISGGTWGSSPGNTDMMRVNINTEESVSFSPSNDFLRMQIRYDQDYFDVNGSGSGPNKPRNNFQWSPGGSGGRIQDGVLWWVSMTYYFPATYEADTSSDNNQEVIFQMHNSSGGSGHLAMLLGGSSSQRGKLTINLCHRDTSDVWGNSSAIQEASIPIDDIKGEFVTLIMRVKTNPFSSNTTIDAGMGRYPQIGEFYNGNQGIFEVWATTPSGAEWASNTLGPVANGGATQMKKICEIINGPVGVVPSWRTGNVGAASTFPGFYMYKGRWMDHILFASRPSIPHVHSSKAGPIVIYVGHIRLGDDTTNYQSMHPTQQAMP